jgi:D-sedoheptulose 7-phosphate isomerase
VVDIDAAIREHQDVIAGVGLMSADIQKVAREMLSAMQAGNKVLWFGNGGSAADSQHLAAELVGRFSRQRRALCSIALTTDTSVLTSVANDFGYDSVFTRQVEALCRRGDIVVGISTSGRSRSVLGAMGRARELGGRTVGFTGGDGGEMRAVSDTCFIVPSSVTARIQEAHILIGHILCDWIESEAVQHG